MSGKVCYLVNQRENKKIKTSEKEFYWISFIGCGNISWNQRDEMLGTALTGCTRKWKLYTYVGCAGFKTTLLIFWKSRVDLMFRKFWNNWNLERNKISILETVKWNKNVMFYLSKHLQLCCVHCFCFPIWKINVQHKVIVALFSLQWPVSINTSRAVN